jgi:cell division protein FtsN
VTRPSRPRRRRSSRPAVLALAAGLLFAVGVALGQALHDNPQPGETQTRVRTLKPLPLPPARVTVTVTTSGP